MQKRMMKEILPHHPLFIFTSLVVVNENLLCCLVAQGNIPDRRGRIGPSYGSFSFTVTSMSMPIFLPWT